MPTRADNKDPAEPSGAAVLFRFRKRNSAFGVTRDTAKKLARELALSETQVLHIALARLANDVLPAYEPDDGPLTDAQLSALQDMVPQGRMKAIKSLL